MYMSEDNDFRSKIYVIKYLPKKNTYLDTSHFLLQSLVISARGTDQFFLFLHLLLEFLNKLALIVNLIILQNIIIYIV